MNEEQLKQAFILWLAKKSGVQSLEELDAMIQLMGEEGLKQAYAQFMQEMQTQMAKDGAKLNYLRQLRGKCPEGYELKYFKKGGQLCKECVKKQEKMEEGGQMPSDPVDAFKCGRKMKKKAACGTKLPKDKCGSKVDMDKCGSKMKKKEEGGSIPAEKCGGKTKKKAFGGSFVPFQNRALN